MHSDQHLAAFFQFCLFDVSDCWCAVEDCVPCMHTLRVGLSEQWKSAKVKYNDVISDFLHTWISALLSDRVTSV